MAFISTHPVASAQDEVFAMYHRQQSAWGFVPNYAKVFSARPEVLARWGRLLAEIKRPMSERRFELVTFVAALELRNSACALAHGNKLRRHLGDAGVMALAEGRPEEILHPTEQAICGFARQVARDASRIEAEDVAALRRSGLTDEEVFDIAAAAAGRAFLTKLLDALGVEPDASNEAIDEPLRSALSVGRAIGAAPVETLPEPDPTRTGERS